jgi:CO/xanthine dehydrogenase Mo-binding subunit
MLRLNINGASHDIDVDPETPLLWVIRDYAGLTGTKYGCGIAYGLTAALHGEISIRQGAVEQSNFHDYPMLRMNEAPAIETFIINSGKSLGGGGEPGTPPIAPAVTNAIFDATGIRIRELPIRKNNLRSEQEHDRH